MRGPPQYTASLLATQRSWLALERPSFRVAEDLDTQFVYSYRIDRPTLLRHLVAALADRNMTLASLTNVWVPLPTLTNQDSGTTYRLLSGDRVVSSRVRTLDGRWLQIVGRDQALLSGAGTVRAVSPLVAQLSRPEFEGLDRIEVTGSVHLEPVEASGWRRKVHLEAAMPVNIIELGDTEGRLPDLYFPQTIDRSHIRLKFKLKGTSGWRSLRVASYDRPLAPAADEVQELASQASSEFAMAATAMQQARDEIAQRISSPSEPMAVLLSIETEFRRMSIEMSGSNISADDVLGAVRNASELADNTSLRFVVDLTDAIEVVEALKPYFCLEDSTIAVSRRASELKALLAPAYAALVVVIIILVVSAWRLLPAFPLKAPPGPIEEARTAAFLESREVLAALLLIVPAFTLGRFNSSRRGRQIVEDRHLLTMADTASLSIPAVVTMTMVGDPRPNLVIAACIAGSTLALAIVAVLRFVTSEVVLAARRFRALAA